MGALFGFGHIEAGAAGNHLFAVLDEVFYQVLEVQQLGTAVDEGDIVHRKTRLQLGQLEQFVQNHIGHHVVAEHIHHTDAVLVALVADVEDALDLALLDEVGRLLDHLALVHTVGDGGGDNHVVSFVVLFDSGVGAEDDRTASGGIGLADTVVAVDGAAEGEVWGFDILHQALDGDLGIVDICHAAVQTLGQVVGGHIGGHTDGDTVRAVDQQVGYLGREDRRLLAFVVVGGHHVDRVLLDIGHEFVRNLAQAGLGVTHGCGRVAVDRAEVTLTVDQRIAHRPVLSQTHQGAIDTGIAVGVVFTHDITYDTGTFLRGGVVEDAVLVHRIEDAAVHGLESVAHIGQSPRHDHRHCIVDIGSLHRLLDIDASDFFVVRNHQSL